jgi:competence protein ComEA
VTRSEIATRALALSTAVAIVVGIYALVPHLRAEQFTPVLLPPPPDHSSTDIVVNITGNVRNPGLYTLDKATPLGDVLALAGVEDADSGHTATIEIDAISATASQKVDLNHAASWLLEALPGIGPEKATAIVAHRENHGPFVCIDDLVMVPGISSVTLEALRDLIIVTP